MARHYQNNFENYLIVQRLAEKTRESYLQAVHGLEVFQKQPADKLNNEQIQDYLILCIQEKELAWSSCNVLFCALKKYYSGYLGRDESKFSIQYYLKNLLTCCENIGAATDPESGSFSAEIKMLQCQSVRLKEFSIMPKKRPE